MLVRATASLRLFEQALEEQGLPTYVVGGRGYWSQEQVRDGLAYLAALANPRDETAFYGVLASPFCGVGQRRAGPARPGGPRGRAAGRGPRCATPAGADGAADAAAAGAWLGAVPARGPRPAAAPSRPSSPAERARAERLPPEALLERAITATGYDLAILARAGGERRLANLRKLMRLAREYEHAEGRDLRGFLDFAITQDLAEAREGEAALESDGLDAVRLMTIHRAKGLEFPVVCVADLGRLGAGGRPRLLIGHDGTAGLRLAPLGGGDAVPALAYERLAAEEDRADAEEERRLLYVAMTRARETLILSGGTDAERWPEPRPGGAPLDWIVRAIAGEPRELLRDRRASTCSSAPGTAAPRACAARSARPPRSGEVLPRAALAPEGGPRPGAPPTALPKAPKVMPAPPVRARPAPQRLSYTALQAYARCGYRFYLQRVLGLPAEPPPPPLEAPQEERTGLDPLVRGGLAHALLEDARLRAPGAARRRRRRRARRPPRRRGHRRATSRTCARSSARSPAPRCASGSRPRPRSAARPASRSRSSRAAAARSSTASST